MQTLMIGSVAVSDNDIDRLTRAMRRLAYFWAFVSFAIVCRWIKISREDIRMFDVAWENNIWTWMNVVFMISAALALLLTAHVRHRTGAPFRGWYLAGFALLMLSLDDMTSLHERFDGIGRAMGGGEGFLHFAWVIPGMIAAALLVAVFWNALRSAAPAVRRSFATGVALFLAGALVFEMISGAVLSAYGHHRPYTILYHIEEILEAVGMVLIFGASVKDLIRQGTPAESADARTSGRPQPEVPANRPA